MRRRFSAGEKERFSAGAKERISIHAEERASGDAEKRRMTDIADGDPMVEVEYESKEEATEDENHGSAAIRGTTFAPDSHDDGTPADHTIPADGYDWRGLHWTNLTCMRNDGVQIYLPLHRLLLPLLVCPRICTAPGTRDNGLPSKQHGTGSGMV